MDVGAELQLPLYNPWTDPNYIVELAWERKHHKPKPEPVFGCQGQLIEDDRQILMPWVLQ